MYDDFDDLLKLTRSLMAEVEKRADWYEEEDSLELLVATRRFVAEVEVYALRHRLAAEAQLARRLHAGRR